MKPIVLTFSSLKGGSGKTSATVSLSSIFAEMGYKVLVIDGDLQGNTSMTFGFPEPGEKNLYNAIVDLDVKEEYNALEYISHTGIENIDIIASSEDVPKLDMYLYMRMERERYMMKVLNSINSSEEANYDFILIDTNPSLGILNVNIFVASDYIIIPVECSAYGIRGLKAIIQFYKDTKKINNNLKICGILLTKVDGRKNVVKNSIENIEKIYGGLIFESQIGVDTNMEKSQWENMTILQYSSNSRVANHYRELAKEVLEIVQED